MYQVKFKSKVVVYLQEQRTASVWTLLLSNWIL